MRRVCLTLLLLMTAGWTSPAPDVVLYCPPALADALRQVADRYMAASHVPVHIFVAPPDGLRGLIAHRARADVLVADAATVAALASQHLVRPETVIRLGQDPYVLIGKIGAFPPQPAPNLVSAHVTVVPDPTTAASFDGAAILRASLPAGASPREIGVSDTPTVIDMVRANGTLLGLVNRTEAHGSGIAEAASLPAPPTPISAALVTQGQSGNEAALLAFIAGPIGTTILRNAGLEVTP